MRPRSFPLAVLALVVASSCREGGPPPPADAEITVTGVLTAEGAECPAMRGADGALYTLTPADLKGFSPGDSVCVKGARAEMSTCMQGTTIVVAWIGRPDQCR
jgi:hypothetical protein